MEIGNSMTKMNWKYRVLIALCATILYTLILWFFDYISDYTSYSIERLIFQGVFFGVLFGIGFPYVIKRIASRHLKKVAGKINPQLDENEATEIEGPANLFRGIEGVGGRIFLTSKKVIFKSHKMNIQRGQTGIEYQNIKELVERKTAKIIDNGIRIVTNDSKEYDFVVNERDLWFEEMKERIKQ